MPGLPREVCQEAGTTEKCQVKTTVRCHFIPIRQAKTSESDRTKCKRGYGQQDLSCSAVAHILVYHSVNLLGDIFEGEITHPSAQGVHTSVIFKNRGYQSGSANHRNKQILQSRLLPLSPREPVAKHLLRTLLDTTHKAKGLWGPLTISKSAKRSLGQKV